MTPRARLMFYTDMLHRKPATREGQEAQRGARHATRGLLRSRNDSIHASVENDYWCSMMLAHNWLRQARTMPHKRAAALEGARTHLANCRLLRTHACHKPLDQMDWMVDNQIRYANLSAAE